MFAAAPGSAQTGTATGLFTERPNAALSRNLRTLAANPKSVTALMGAGQAALELGDAQAALTFFARAEEQMPRDGRVKMWIASALVQLQQPHAALKFFRDATELGVPAADVARDRGLAHDLAGNPRDAQRDYRTALLKGRDDEATRRLALSLAISGEREPALQLLENQLLVRDRSAERARALVLALTGDTAGATRAVQAAMPGPQAGAMRPFLARLPALSPAERALAVHLGVFPSDARTAAQSTYAANDFANAVTDAGRPDPSQRSLARRSQPPEPVSTEPRRRPGAEQAIAVATPRTPTRRPVASPGAEEGLDGVRQRSTASPGFAASSPAWAGSRGLVPSQVEAAPARTPLPSEATTAPALTGAPPVLTPAAEASPPPPPQQAEPEPGSQPAEVRIAAVEPSAAPLLQQPEPEPRPQPAEVRIAAAEPAAPPPQSEAVPSGSRLADLSATIADIAEWDAVPAQTVASRPGARGASAAAAGVRPRATAAKPKPAATAAAKKPKAAPADPSRVWVQVAGGADKGALPREYARLKAKAPKLLGPRGAWTAPLNATNRLLVGPFASAREAQAFVNQLKVQDLSGFAWTSAAGQKVEKLAAK